MKIVKYYIGIAVVIFSTLIFIRPTLLLLNLVLIWIAASLFTVSYAYVANKPSIFRKKGNGAIPAYIRWLFWPFLVGASIYNFFARRLDKVPPVQQINEHVFLACRLFPSDIQELRDKGVTGILDVTAEFDGLDWSSEDNELRYLNIPVLDHTSPNSKDLKRAITWLHNQILDNGKVVIHCALGRGRSVLVTAAYLLSQDETLTLPDAMKSISTIRETARLNTAQYRALTAMRNDKDFFHLPSSLIIANPVSGGGKWPAEKQYIKARLATEYLLNIKETTPDVSAQQLAEEGLSQGYQTIIACGGDGTLAEVAHAVADTRCTLGIIPLGTANALSMVLLGTSSKLTPVDSALDVIINGQTCKIDTATCNGTRVLLLCALGIEANMIKKSDREEKNEKGQWAYIQYFFESLIDSPAASFHIVLDDNEKVDIQTQSLVIANAAPFTTLLAQGGGNPDIQDGLLDVNWIEGKDSTHFLTTLATFTANGVFNEKLDNAVQFKQCKTIHVQSDREFDYVVDGEVSTAQSLRIESHPASLTVFSNLPNAA
ncbi:hypothetical protein DRW07_05545 [Alteromonas sediminis]|uniref:Diacylglycerol kinase n=1 Tax=Alteromonas sediminis TaxID=2259342 RepID=A0A3N5ZBK5_9ALTE|nr:diacylglycerol kinase family protein [Alteromonas sediminis]RPJ67008.1 hypothetical protein DRW07_05545 [Alteromonas sediminis]